MFQGKLMLLSLLRLNVDAGGGNRIPRHVRIQITTEYLNIQIMALRM